jgi:hypothetical protein
MNTQPSTYINLLPFAQWMHSVDLTIQRITGLSADDLPDYCYRDAYEDGLSPAQAARRAVRAAME